jgi:hypothetical protein
VRLQRRGSAPAWLCRDLPGTYRWTSAFVAAAGRCEAILFLIAPGSTGSRALSLLKPLRRRTGLTVAGETPTCTAICLPVQRCRRSYSISSTTPCGVGCRSRCGRGDRSCKPTNPSWRHRSTHFRTVRGQTPAARGAAFGVCRSPPAARAPLDQAASTGHSCGACSFGLRNTEASQSQRPLSGPDG